MFVFKEDVNIEEEATETSPLKIAESSVFSHSGGV